jgi:hypothetical protein
VQREVEPRRLGRERVERRARARRLGGREPRRAEVTKRGERDALARAGQRRGAEGQRSIGAGDAVAVARARDEAREHRAVGVELERHVRRRRGAHVALLGVGGGGEAGRMGVVSGGSRAAAGEQPPPPALPYPSGGLTDTTKE